MKLSKEAAELFAKEIARAKARGMTHFAKSAGCPAMRFGATLEDAKQKAAKDARAIARAAGCPTMPPSVQSGELA
jgi:Fe-S cluster assembly iron-binding protein IscA